MKHYLKISTLLTLAAALAPLQGSALPESYYTQSSVLSEGNWIKIKVSREGIQQITYDELRKWGIDPEKATVWGYDATLLSTHNFSTQIPDDLPQVPVFRNGDRLCFYGRGSMYVSVSGMTLSSRRNLQDNDGYYFITDSRQGIDIEQSGSATVDHTLTTVTTHTTYSYTEPEKFNPTGSSPLFFDDKLSAGESRDFTFDMTGISGPGCLNYRYIGRVTSSSTIRVGASTGITLLDLPTERISNSNMGDPHHVFNFSNRDVLNYRFDTSSADPSAVSFKFTVPASSSIEYMSMDFVGVAFPRYNIFDSAAGQMRMDFQNINTASLISVSGCTPGMMVWDIASSGVPTQVATEIDSKGLLVFNALPSKSVILFDPSGTFHTAEIVGKVANQNLHGLPTPDMLIISGTGFESYAERFADIHRQFQGMDVAVATHEDILNEFSTGARSVDSYRRLAKMLYDRNPGKLKYIMFVGSGWYDARGITNTVQPGRLLVYNAERDYAVNNLSRNYCNDAFFGMLDDSFNAASDYRTIPNVAVGRISGTKAADFEAYLAKVEDYIKGVPASKPTEEAIVLTCDGDKNTHLQQGQSMTGVILNKAPETTVNQLYSALYYYKKPDTYGQQIVRLKALLNQGVDFFYYSGHAGAGGILGIDLNSAANIDFGRRPVTFLATCETWPFDMMTDRSITDELLFADKGPLNVISSGRTVYQSLNGKLGDAFGAVYYDKNDDSRCVGDMWLKALGTTTSNGTSLQCYNNMCYNLAGDPALPVYRPTLGVTLKTIDGNDVTADDASVVSKQPLSPFVLSGTINNADGTVDETFNGTVTVSVYETPTDKMSYLDNESDKNIPAVNVTRDETLLTRHSATVTDGKWTVTVNCPEPTQAVDDRLNRIALFAVSDDSQRSASGCDAAHLSIAAIADAIPGEGAGPDIVDAYLNSSDFADGGIVSANNRLYARIISTGSGINMSSTSIGGTAKIVIDNKLTFNDVATRLRPNTDGTVSLDYCLPTLSEGRHTLLLTVADNAGNYTDRTISFNVVNAIDATLVVTGGDPARESVEIGLTTSAGNLSAGRIVVEDATGTTVYSAETTRFPYTWDLRDKLGNRVPDGAYRVFAILGADGVRFATPAVKVTVIK